ncbi:hypothetical protein ACIQYL_06805 [Lysinibacillus xylanilyticus]
MYGKKKEWMNRRKNACYKKEGRGKGNLSEYTLWLNVQDFSPNEM